MTRVLKVGDHHNLLGKRSVGNPHQMYLPRRGRPHWKGRVTFETPQEFKKGINVNVVGDNALDAADLNDWTWQGNDDTNHSAFFNPAASETVFDGVLQYNGTAGDYAVRIGGAWLVFGLSVTAGQSPYTVGSVLPVSNYMVDTRAGAVTIVLPTTPRLGQVVVVKDWWGNAATNAITVDGTANTIELDNTTLVMDSDLEARWFQWDGVSDWWLI